MASALYRLGGWSFDRRRVVLGAWVVVLVAMALLAGTLKGTESDSFTVPGTEAQQALDLLDAKFPGTGGATARIVFAAPSGHTLGEPQYGRLVGPTVALAHQVPQSVGGASGFRHSIQVARDGRIGFADLHFGVSVDKLRQSTKDALERVAGPARRAGLEVEFSGGVVSTAKVGEGPGELVGIALAFVVLLVSFGRLLPAGIPLVTAIFGVALGLLGITAASGAVSVPSTAPTLAVMLGLAVGIDYALFILSRHRQQLAAGMPVRESAARAVATAGSAVVFAGTTVVIALTGLLVVGIPFLSVMGLAAAGTVAIAVLIALTLLPAFFGFAGDRLRGGRHVAPERSAGRRWAELVTRRPLPVTIAVVALVALVALPALHLRLGLPDDGTKPTNTTERRAYDLLTQGFGKGFNGPLTAVVVAPHRRNPEQFAAGVAAYLKRLPDVASVSPPLLNRTGDVSIVQVTPASSPQSEATRHLVALMRNRAERFKRYGITGLVTGPTAAYIDTAAKLRAALPAFLPLIVGLAFVLLLLTFRSVLVPIQAVVGFLLTLAAAFGAVVWIFQQGHLDKLLGVPATAPIASFLPIIMIAILFGLAMDYEVFLVSRMREQYVHGGEPTGAVVRGFSLSARVVTAAAVIMTSVFASFIAGDDLIIKSFGVALAFGVLIDAFLVRMTLVPAMLALSGRQAWYLPRSLDRALPDLDIEGEHLHEELPARDTEREPIAAGAPA
jgi:RND superfamily putative drug exporter